MTEGRRGWLRRWLSSEGPPPGFRGTHLFPVVSLPEDFVPPSAAFVSEGEIIGYEVGGKLYHPADVRIVRVGPDLPLDDPGPIEIGRP